MHSVMAGLVPALHALLALMLQRKAWMPGTRPGMTAESLRPSSSDGLRRGRGGEALLDELVDRHVVDLAGAEQRQLFPVHDLGGHHDFGGAARAGERLEFG